MGTLAVITAPTSEPITLAQARDQVRVDDADSDAKLASLILAAREWAQGETRRVFVTQTLELYLDEFPAWEIILPVGPVQSITSITYYDGSNALQTLAAARYDANLKSNPPRISPAYGYDWPDTYDRHNAVIIRFVAGYSADHADLFAVREAMLHHIEAHYDRDDRNYDALMRMAEGFLAPLRTVRV